MTNKNGKMYEWINEVINDNSSTVEVLGARQVGKTEAVVKLFRYYDKVILVGDTKHKNDLVLNRTKKEVNGLKHKGRKYELYYDNTRTELLTTKKYKLMEELTQYSVKEYDLIIFHDCNPTEREIEELRTVCNYDKQIYIFDYKRRNRKQYIIDSFDVMPDDKEKAKEFHKKLFNMHKNLNESGFKREILFEKDIWQVD